MTEPTPESPIIPGRRTPLPDQLRYPLAVLAAATGLLGPASALAAQKHHKADSVVAKLERGINQPGGGALVAPFISINWDNSNHQAYTTTLPVYENVRQSNGREITEWFRLTGQNGHVKAIRIREPGLPQLTDRTIHASGSAPADSAQNQYLQRVVVSARNKLNVPSAYVRFPNGQTMLTPIGSTQPAIQPGIIGHDDGQRIYINGIWNGQTPPVAVGQDQFGNQLAPATEFAPWQVAYDSKTNTSTLEITTEFSVTCQALGNLATSSVIDCTHMTGANITSEADSLKYTADQVPANDVYKMKYSGVTSSTTLPDGKVILSLHNENENIIRFKPGGEIDPPGTGNNFSGFRKGYPPYNPATGTGTSAAYWNANGFVSQPSSLPWPDNPAYAGFQSIAIASVANGRIVTPVTEGLSAWPSLGYNPDATGNQGLQYMGVRHGFEFIDGNYAYEYYQDTSGNDANTGNGAGPLTGEKVNRIPLSSLGVMAARRNYNPDTGRWDVPSFPDGLTMSNLNDPNMLAKHGAMVRALWNSNEPGGFRPVAFEVAGIDNYPGHYMGDEIEFNNNTGLFRSMLWYSTNLVDWHQLGPVPAIPGVNYRQEDFSTLYTYSAHPTGGNTSLQNYNPATHQLPITLISAIGSKLYRQRLAVTLP